MKKHSQEFYDYHEMVAEIESRNNVDIRDYAGYLKKIDDYPIVAWAKKHGLDYTVLDGELEIDSPEYNERIRINNLYSEAADGEALEPEYLDFWHYAIEDIFYDVTNGCYRHFDPWELKQDIEPTPKNIWIIEILDMFISLLEEQGITEGIEVRIEW